MRSSLYLLLGTTLSALFLGGQTCVPVPPPGGGGGEEDAGPEPVGGPCTLEYDLAPSVRLSGTPLNLFNGTWTLPTGKMIVEVDGDPDRTPIAGGRAELLFMYVPMRFSATAQGLTLAPNVNGFVSSCSGTTNPAPAGETTKPYSTPPATCAYTPGTTAMATGTFTGTTIAWDACTRASGYSGNDYTYGSTSVSTGPGCAKGYRAVGVITCTDNSALGTCGAANLGDGQNLENGTFNSPLETVTFTNGYANASIPFAYVPNNLPGSTAISWTAVRTGGTCR